MSAITTLQSLLHNAGKKSYLFLVGKLNEAKLSNFAEIDCFVLVACALNTMFDSKGFAKDVVTVFEMERALKGKEWDGSYQTEFQKTLQEDEREKRIKEEQKANSASSPSSSSSSSSVSSLSDDLANGMRFDPISGKMLPALASQLRAHGIRLKDAEGRELNRSAEEAGAEGEGGQLITTDHQLVRVEDGYMVEFQSAAQFFHDPTKRSWRGLDATSSQEAAIIQPGLSGIARKYHVTGTKPTEETTEKQQ